MQLNKIQQDRSFILHVIMFGIIAAFCNLKCSPNKIKPTSVTASSQLRASANYSYGPEMLNDDKPGTTWAEGVKGDGIREYLLFDFGAAQQVAAMEIINGFAEMHAKLGDLYFANNRVQSLQLEFDDGTESLSLRDGSKEFQAITFRRPHTSTRVKVTIKGVYRGAKFNDTCISELRFLDPKQTERSKGSTAPEQSRSPRSAAGRCACIYLIQNPNGVRGWPENYCRELPTCIDTAECDEFRTGHECLNLEKCMPGTCSNHGYSVNCGRVHARGGFSCQEWSQ